MQFLLAWWRTDKFLLTSSKVSVGLLQPVKSLRFGQNLGPFLIGVVPKVSSKITTSCSPGCGCSPCLKSTLTSPPATSVQSAIVAAPKLTSIVLGEPPFVSFTGITTFVPAPRVLTESAFSTLTPLSVKTNFPLVVAAGRTIAAAVVPVAFTFIAMFAVAASAVSSPLLRSNLPVAGVPFNVTLKPAVEGIVASAVILSTICVSLCVKPKFTSPLADVLFFALSA